MREGAKLSQPLYTELQRQLQESAVEKEDLW